MASQAEIWYTHMRTLTVAYLGSPTTASVVACRYLYVLQKQNLRLRLAPKYAKTDHISKSQLAEF